MYFSFTLWTHHMLCISTVSWDLDFSGFMWFHVLLKLAVTFVGTCNRRHILLYFVAVKGVVLVLRKQFHKLGRISNDLLAVSMCYQYLIIRSRRREIIWYSSNYTPVATKNNIMQCLLSINCGYSLRVPLIRFNEAFSLLSRCT